MRRAALFLFLVIFVLFMAGCGSQSTSPPPINGPVAGVPVGLTVTDTPPAGVTVLFFQLNITGASLLSSPSGNNIGLLCGTNTIPVNVTQLQTESALLCNQAGGPGETFTGLTLTFANPQLTVYNGSGSTIGSGANACANNTVCQLTPAVTSSTLTFSAAPFPITLTANAPVAFKLDIHLDTIIQPDSSGIPTVNLGATNGVTISQLGTPSAGTPTPGLGQVTGTIQTLTSNQFILQTFDGRSFEITVNGSTSYSYPSSVCSTNSFACLATQQVVKAQVSLQALSILLASEVDYVEPGAQTVVEGSIIQLTNSGGNRMMDLILQQGPPTPSTATALPTGQRVTVTVPPTGVNYAIDSDSFTLPSGLTFTTAANLMVGQEVSVVVVPGSVTTTSGPSGATPIVGPAATTFTAGSITLEPSQITGVVSGWAPVNTGNLTFTLNTYPNYFVPPAATAGAPPILSPINIDVQATSATTYTNLTPDNISGLAVGDVVSLKGWLFPYSVVPMVCIADWGCASIGKIAAETVVGRPGATPLF
jgi:hypothetical protein